METITARCEMCGTVGDQCIPYEGEWSDLGMCPACFSDVPASEDCDVCAQVVNRRYVGPMDDFTVVYRQDEVIGFRHLWCSKTGALYEED